MQSMLNRPLLNKDLRKDLLIGGSQELKTDRLYLSLDDTLASNEALSKAPDASSRLSPRDHLLQTPFALLHKELRSAMQQSPLNVESQDSSTR